MLSFCFCLIFFLSFILIYSILMCCLLRCNSGYGKSRNRRPNWFLHWSNKTNIQGCNEPLGWSDCLRWRRDPLIVSWVRTVLTPTWTGVLRNQIKRWTNDQSAWPSDAATAVYPRIRLGMNARAETYSHIHRLTLAYAFPSIALLCHVDFHTHHTYTRCLCV